MPLRGGLGFCQVTDALFLFADGIFLFPGAPSLFTYAPFLLEPANCPRPYALIHIAHSIFYFSYERRLRNDVSCQVTDAPSLFSDGIFLFVGASFLFTDGLFQKKERGSLLNPVLTLFVVLYPEFYLTY